MKEAFVGFDSAWSAKNQGAISYAVSQNGVWQRTEVPRPASFNDAAEIIMALHEECDDVLVAIDQPIIVPNPDRSRPVDGVARSLMSRLRSGVQSANRNKTFLFGDEAPIWEFIGDIGFCEFDGTTNHAASRYIVDFEAARIATGQTRVIEVYPALALPTLEPEFMARRRAARYNPCTVTYCLGDWRLVCETVRRYAADFHLQTLSNWARQTTPSKRHQDQIDATLCLLIALQWRRNREQHGMSVIGDLNQGYMVTPTSDETREILEAACAERGVAFG